MSNSITKPQRDAWFVTPLLVLAISLAGTLAAAYFVHATSEARDDLRYQQATAQALESVRSRIGAYTAALHNIDGLFAAKRDVTVSEFEAYFQTTQLDRLYSGLQAVGFAVALKPPEVEAFVAKQQVDRPAYAIWRRSPVEHQATESQVAAVTFIEPRSPRNLGGLGFDILSDPLRRPALQSAVLKGDAVATARLFLLNEPDDDRQPGFAIFLPVFRPAHPTMTAEQRSAAVAGWVFIGLRMGDFMKGIFPRGGPAEVWIDLYDGAANSPDGQLFADSGPRVEESRFQLTEHLTVANRTWTAHLGVRPQFLLGSSRPLLLTITVIGGLLVSLLLTFVTFSLARSRSRSFRASDDLRESQSRLHQSELRFRRLVESNVVGVVFVSSSGRITEINGEALRMLGRSHATAIEQGLDWRRLTPPEFRENEERADRQLKASGAAQPFETEFLRPDGLRTPALVGTAVVDAAAGTTAWLLVDISARKRFETELERAKNAAVAANSAKDRFLAVLSHELRTPLTPALALAAAAEENTAFDPEVRHEFATIRRNIELESRLIDDLLDLTKIGRGKIKVDRRVIDLHETITAAIDVTSRESIDRKRLDIRVELGALAHHVLGDTARLQQVLWNLLQNAVKFTPADGVIQVRTRNLPNPDPTSETGETIEVEVLDTGRGIEAEQLETIFQAFEQGPGDLSQGGLGLGLAISRGLVHAHGGTIQAFSEGRDKGSRFEIRLNTAPVPRRKLPPEVAPPPSAELNATVLLVEDHPDTAMVLSRLLARTGLRVTTASTVADACRVLDAEVFELVISDIGLPDGTGLSVARHARSGHNAATIAIALTGYGMDADIVATQSAGFDKHITKPVNFALLRETVMQLLAARKA